MKVDFIIVGQGLAGTLLANELILRKKSILVIDDPSQFKASVVAAGLINPVVFRRLTKSWFADTVFPQMETTYRQLEKLLNQKFYFPCQINRILSEDETHLWKDRVFANRLSNYADLEPYLHFKNQAINFPHGIGRITKAGRIDLQKLIFSYTAFLEQNSLIRKEKFSFEKLKLKPDLISYDDILAEKIIFCEGHAASENPYFERLKFKHSKGELLEVKIPELGLGEIISKDLFVMPLGEDCYKVGATYTWDKLNGDNTDTAREDLLSRLKSITPAKPVVLNQMAGIRPTMHDRKPVLGFLPDSPQIGIFNGLGSKGVMLGPFFARQFALHILDPSEIIHPEASITRYFRKK